ncbi:vacuolar protein sorting-associated protein 37D-like [Oncorhynchus clarkii lewisi]|uniref:vacuolar protein sorting-associated protein 37D-like n=1 Tax=Oncorhynchus clarkii lewisi TaxID=490388 RepID=UPI0039B92B53
MMPWHFDSKSVTDQLRVLRTVELRELLRDEEKISQIIRFSQKFQGLQGAKETVLVSNSRLAETSLSHEPELNTGKLWLAKKYQELEKFTNIIQAKQNQLVLVEKQSLHMVQWLLLNKLAHSEEECDALSQRFTDGKISLEHFVESCQRSCKLYHIRLVQAEKIQEFIKPEHKPQRPTENHNSREPSVYFPLSPHPNICHVFYGLTPAIILPNVYHSVSSAPVHFRMGPYLPPLSDHIINSAQLMRPVASPFDTCQPVGLRVYGKGHAPRWPARPVRLQRLNNIQSRHLQQDPPPH